MSFNLSRSTFESSLSLSELISSGRVVELRAVDDWCDLSLLLVGVVELALEGLKGSVVELALGGLENSVVELALEDLENSVVGWIGESLSVQIGKCCSCLLVAGAFSPCFPSGFF